MRDSMASAEIAAAAANDVKFGTGNGDLADIVVHERVIVDFRGHRDARAEVRGRGGLVRALASVGELEVRRLEHFVLGGHARDVRLRQLRLGSVNCITCSDRRSSNEASSRTRWIVRCAARRAAANHAASGVS